MRAVIAAVLLLLPIAAVAQPVPHAFAPYTIDLPEHNALMALLGDVPAKYANPIILQLMQAEQRAQAQAAVKRSAATAKPPEKKP